MNVSNDRKLISQSVAENSYFIGFTSTPSIDASRSFDIFDTEDVKAVDFRAQRR